MKITMVFEEGDDEAAKLAMKAPVMASDIESFMSDLKYKYKYSEMDEKESALYYEIFDLACKYFNEYIS